MRCLALVVWLGVGLAAPSDAGEFANPESVAILGYADHAMEPFVSRDGRFLLFNDSNDPSVDTNLHYAERVDDTTFQYRGEIGGVNSTSLDAVASMDDAGTLYFISLRSYPQTLATIHRGAFAEGVVSGVELVAGLAAPAPLTVHFDAEISPGGDTLTFAEGEFAPGGSVPLTADLHVAGPQGGGFEPLPDSATLLAQVNTDDLEYAPALSRSGLELFFTRLGAGPPEIHAATRASTAEPFGPSVKIAAITGIVEAPTLSPDERSLYYHENVAGTFVIRRVTRAPEPGSLALALVACLAVGVFGRARLA